MRPGEMALRPPKVQPRPQVRATRLDEEGHALVNEVHLGFRVFPDGDIAIEANFAVLKESRIEGGTKVVPVSVGLARIKSADLIENYKKAIAEERAAESDG